MKIVTISRGQIGKQMCQREIMKIEKNGGKYIRSRFDANDFI
jgi:hypothetical protein